MTKVPSQGTPDDPNLSEITEIKVTIPETKKTKTTAQVQIPTPGRMVIYHHPHGDEIQDLAAFVANVSRAGEFLLVNLMVIELMGTTFGTTGIKEGPGPGEWSWPVRS